MSWSALFTLTNAVAFAAWAMLLFLPRRPLVLSAVLYAGVGLLCLCYVAMFVALFGGLADPHRLPGVGTPDLLDYSIGGLQRLFMSDGGLVLGWTHYLAFDLFVGLWVAREADRLGFSRAVQVPILFLVLMVAPLGLLVWLIMREARSRRAARSTT